MRPRVLHVLDPEPNDNVGGADLHVVDLAEMQKRASRYEPTVLLLSQAPLVEERLALAGVDVLAGYRLGHRYLEAPFRLQAALARVAPRLIHSHGYDANYFVALARLMQRCSWGVPRLLLTSHGWIDGPSQLNVLKTWLDLLTHRFSDHVIICSPHQRERALRAAGHDNITFVCNGVPADRGGSLDRISASRRFGFPAGSKVVAFVGRLSAEKRIDVFIETAAIVARSLADVHFVIAGGGPLFADAERRLREQGLTDRVTMVGVLRDIDSLYRHVDVLVVPSDMETTSRVTIEALMWAVPVVASDLPGLRCLVDSGQEGFLCPPGDVAAFAMRVTQLLTDAPTHRAMGSRGRAKARDRFSVQRMCCEVEEVYDAVLGPNSSNQRRTVAAV
jgi:glycosyltransferase involved in cell wall biosynthesis